MSIVESYLAPLLLAACVAGVLGATPNTSIAQSPPAPPPTPDSIQADDPSADPPTPDEASGDNSSDDGAPSDDGEVPVPPSTDELEGQPAPDEDRVDQPDSQLSPSQRYDNQYLQIGRTSGDPIAPMLEYGSQMIAKRGTFGSIVDPIDFYEKIGRPDLARKFERRSTARTVVLGTSAITATVVPYVLYAAGMAISPFCFGPCTPEQQRRERTANTLFIMSGVTFAAGAATLLGSIFWSAHPVSVAERRELADDYNQSLRDELGVSATRRSPPVDVQFGAAPVQDGAVGVFTLTF